MRIAIIGSRGIPARYGGFETLAEQLSHYLSERGHDVTVIGEQVDGSDGNGRVHRVSTMFSKGSFPVLFYFESVLRTLWGFDVVLMLGVGGGPFLPLLRVFRNRVVTNVDGLEHLRGKFSPLKKWYVRMSQWMVAWFSDMLVADAQAIREDWIRRFGISEGRIKVIRYGARFVSGSSTDALKDFGVSPREYYLGIARIVPENNLEMIIEGFGISGSEKKLLLIGNWDSSSYGQRLSSMNKEQVIYAGPCYDADLLDQLRFNAFGYLHGHSVGGTNPSLVEALASSAVCICHDNPFNRETTSGKALFFNDADGLADRIRQLEAMPESEVSALRLDSFAFATTCYSIDAIGTAYLSCLVKN